MLRIGDIAAIVFFMLVLAGIGIYFARRNNSTEEYFLGNRSFPGWAIGLSMLGTSISSVTFLALPAAAYVLDYRQFVSNLALPLAAVLALIFFIPFFRRSKATSAFEYLEQRYGVFVRTFAALSFILLQFIRVATVLYLVSIPIAGIFDVGLVWVIVIGGVFIGFYTVIGGIEAVIWTDVIQTIILLLGGMLCLAIIIFKLPGGLRQVVEVGGEFNKFSFGPVNWNLGERTLTVMIILGLVSSVTGYASDQNIVQRYIAAKSTREARKATLICALMSLPTWLSFYFLGTCMFVFYKVFGSAEVIKMHADEVLPHFILTQTPQFVGGLIVAACLAAAMSSLDSSINSITTIWTIDFVRRFGRTRSDAEQLYLAKIVAIGVGAGMILGALIISTIPKESIVDFNLIVVSIFGGGMLTIYMFGFFSKRVGNRAIMTGLIPAVMFNIYLGLNSMHVLPEAMRCGIHSYWTSILVNLVLMTVAYAASFLWPNRRPLDGLTIWTIKLKQ